MTTAAVFFWISAAWLFYVWAGYPLALRALSLIRRFRPMLSEHYWPTVSVLIAAHNEEKDIPWKLAETLAWEYPRDRLQVLVGSDASTDGTDRALKSIRDSRFIFARSPERAGKNAMLNRLARMAHGEIYVFTDANTQVGPQCLRKMIRHFSDSRVGCVTGMERNSADTGTMVMGSNAYLTYECAINTIENKLGSVLVCDGSLYCLRRSLFTDLDPELANDLEHPIRVGAAGAYVLFEPEARSVERCTSSGGEEFARRRRIAAQGALGMWRLRRHLQGLRRWQFISRKLLRWLGALPLSVVLATSVVLSSQSFFAVLLLAQLCLYSIALAGALHKTRSRSTGLWRVPYVWLVSTIAVFIGVLDACRGRTFATWNSAMLSRGREKAA